MSNVVDKDEFDNLQINVASKRKQYPKLCAKLLYDTLLTEISAMQSAVVEIDDNQNTSRTEVQQNAEQFREEMKNAVEAVKSMDIVNRTDMALKNLVNMEHVLQDTVYCEEEVLMQKFIKEQTTSNCQNK